ncbi:MAG: tetratricopeptide repeat protein [Flavisolibacter sp.]
MKALLLFFVFYICAVKLNAQDTNTLINKGNRYYQTSQFDVAEMQYRKALEVNNKSIAAQYNLANALQKQKKYDEAEQVLDRLIASSNDKSILSSSYYNKGVALTKTKDLEASIDAYKKALLNNPSDKEARENLQKALLELKQKQEQKKNQDKQKQPKMNQKDADQKLKLLQQKERNLQQRLQNQKKGAGQSEDW